MLMVRLQFEPNERHLLRQPVVQSIRGLQNPAPSQSNRFHYICPAGMTPDGVRAMRPDFFMRYFYLLAEGRHDDYLRHRSRKASCFAVKSVVLLLRCVAMQAAVD